MKITIIGSGNVATLLGRLILKSKHTIVQIVSRNKEEGKILAKTLKCGYADFHNNINSKADLFIVAVSDTALEECAAKLNLKNKLVVHTAGAVSKNILKNVSGRYGVLYPLQSIRKEIKKIPSIPFLIDAENEIDLKLLMKFARSLSKNVSIANDEERLKLHAAAVIVSNFTNHLYAMAEAFCKNENLNFNLLKPLITETASRIRKISPSDLQTGPAIRNDKVTIEKHLELLSNYPKLKAVYNCITESIIP